MQYKLFKFSFVFTLLFLCNTNANYHWKKAQAQDDVDIIKVGVSAQAYSAPFIELDRNGDFVGFDLDLLDAIAQEANFEIEIVAIPWAEQFDMLLSGELDILAGEIAFTEQRAEIADFVIYYHYLQSGETFGFVIRKDFPELFTAVQMGFEEVVDNGTYDILHRKWFETPAPAEFQP